MGEDGEVGEYDCYGDFDENLPLVLGYIDGEEELFLVGLYILPPPESGEGGVEYEYNGHVSQHVDINIDYYNQNDSGNSGEGEQHNSCQSLGVAVYVEGGDAGSR